MIITGSEFIELTEGVELAYQQAEDEIIFDIVERLAKNNGITATAEWELEKLAEMGGLQMSTIKTISKASGVAQTDITKAVTKITKSSVKEIDSLLYGKMVSGTTGEVIPSSERVAGIVGAITQNAKNIGNITNATMLNSACDAYKNIVNNVGLDIEKDMNAITIGTAIGAQTIQDAVTKEVKHLADNGITGFIDSAGHHWQADTYMTMVARTSVSNAYHTAQKQRAEDYGVETFQIVPHYGARPLCAPYQGHYFSWDGSGGKVHDLYGNTYSYDSIYNTSYGQPAGIFGINCRHTTRVCADGLFVPRDEPFTKEENEKNQEVYENLQKQRYYERQVRSAKREALCMKEIGNEEAFAKASYKLQQKQKNMVAFCNEHGLTVRSYRTGVAGFTKEISQASKNAVNQMLKAYEQADSLQTKSKIAKKLTETVNADKEELANLKAKLFDMGNPSYSNIWKQDVTLDDWDYKHGAIQAKEEYFKAQMAKDPDNPKWQGLLDDLHDFDAKGQAYWALKNDINKIENPLIKLQSGATRFIDEGVAYPQSRLDKALWAKDPREADKMLRAKCGQVWRSASEAEKDAIYEYTTSYSKFNEPLRGIEYGTQKKLGVGNVDLDMIGVNNWYGYKKGEVHKLIDNMSAIIEKSSYDSDIWLQRGCGYAGMDDFFGISMETFRLPEKELKKILENKEYTEHAFMSCGTAKGRGFPDKPIIMNIFAPKGTKMMYAEPFSYYGHGSKRSWNGISEQSSFGIESEIIGQHGTRMLCTKVEKAHGKIFFDMEIVGQGF